MRLPFILWAIINQQVIQDWAEGFQYIIEKFWGISFCTPDFSRTPLIKFNILVGLLIKV
jgi:hypothetical protein